MATLEQIKQAQLGVFTLQAQGVEMSSPEGRRALNRLMGAIRGATPEDLEAFNQWVAEERQKLGLEQ